MLQLKNLQLKENLVIIFQHAVVVNEYTSSGIKKDHALVKHEKDSRIHRTGEIIAHGPITDEVIEMLSLSSLKANDANGVVINRNTILLNQLVLFEVNGADVFDLPVVYNELDKDNEEVSVSNAVKTNAQYLLGIVNMIDQIQE